MRTITRLKKAEMELFREDAKIVLTSRELARLVDTAVEQALNTRYLDAEAADPAEGMVA